MTRMKKTASTKRITLLTIGDEITRGELVDTNAAWLADQCTTLGCDVRAHLSVPDDIENIVAAFRMLATQSDVIITTGGLGPTTDDLTREAIAALLGVDVILSEEATKMLKRALAKRGRTLDGSRDKQGWLPAGAKPLPNSAGTAPGVHAEFGAATIYSLPGVPRECRTIFQQTIAERVRNEPPHIRRLQTVGVPESQLGARIESLALRSSAKVGYRASIGQVEIKLMATADVDVAALNHDAEAIRNLIGSNCFAVGNVSLAERVGELLRESELRVTVAESCTGGRVGAALTAIPGSSRFFDGGVIAYANALKVQSLDVPEDTLRAHGAVSFETALAMAEGARRKYDSDLSVSITGIAGPTGGSEEKPVGTVWFATSSRDGAAHAERRLFSGDRHAVQERAAIWALEMLRRSVLGKAFVASNNSVWR